MFPLQRDNALVIQFSNSNHQQQGISEDLILEECASLDANHDSHKIFATSHSSKKLFYEEENNHEVGISSNNNNIHKKKKMVHREIERLRRQEMSTLYASLRSLLPLDFIKGKRSISDHMNEAVKYISQLQNNIKDLSSKRDQLKNKLSNHPYEDTTNNNPKSGTFTIHHHNGLVAIEIAGGGAIEEEGVTLSRLIKLLLDEGLEVVNYISTIVNGRLVQSFQCSQVNNCEGVDLSELRRKLGNLIPSFGCSD